MMFRQVTITLGQTEFTYLLSIGQVVIKVIAEAWQVLNKVPKIQMTASRYFSKEE
jgi:hypothetical protein